MGPLDRVEDYLNEFRGVYLILGIFLFRSRFIGSQNAANEIPCSLYEILIEFMFVVSPSNQETIEKQVGTEPLFFSASYRAAGFHIPVGLHSRTQLAGGLRRFVDRGGCLGGTFDDGARQIAIVFDINMSLWYIFIK